MYQWHIQYLIHFFNHNSAMFFSSVVTERIWGMVKQENFLTKVATTEIFFDEVVFMEFIS